MVNNADVEGEGLLREAVQKALRLLSYGDRSKRALYQKLRDAGFEHGVSQAAATKMEELGYINDDRFAANYAASAVESKGHGQLRIVRDLMEKGIPKEIAERAVNDYFDNDDDDEYQYQYQYRDPELDNAVAVLQKRLRRIEPSQLDQSEKRRAYAYLMRRGFKCDTINSAFKEWGAEDDE